MDSSSLVKKLFKKESKNDKKGKNKPKEVIAAGGVVYFVSSKTHEVKFLLLKHKGPKKHWDLPKGHLERGETIQECAIREVHEESGISISELHLIKELDHKNIYTIKKKLRGNKKKIVHLFLFKAETDEVLLSREHKDYKWVKFSNLEKKLTYPQTSYPAFVEAFEIIKNNL